MARSALGAVAVTPGTSVSSSKVSSALGPWLRPPTEPTCVIAALAMPAARKSARTVEARTTPFMGALLVTRGSSEVNTKFSQRHINPDPWNLSEGKSRAACVFRSGAVACAGFGRRR